MPSNSTATSWGWTAWPSQQRAEHAGPRRCCFETLRAYDGRIFALEAHLDRLMASAQDIGLRTPRRAAITAAVLRMARRAGNHDAVMRVMLAEEKLLLMSRQLRPYPRRWYREGVAVATAVTSRYGPASLSPQTKHADLLPGILARAESAPDLVEIVYRTHEGFVGEGTVSNACIVTKDGQLATTPPARGVLAGITCRVLMRLAPSLGLVPCWVPLTRHDLWNAAEMFLANTTFEVLPVVRYDGRVIGNGRPGPWTRRLHAAFRAHVREAVTRCK